LSSTEEAEAEADFVIGGEAVEDFVVGD